MNKKSITCLEKDDQSSRTELSHPALQDIIATNHIVLRKEPDAGRLSRACKAAIFMLILGLITIGIIALTLVFAYSRNNLMATLARSAEANALSTSNETRLLLVNQENLTTLSDEQNEDNWQTSTVTLTSHHLHRLTSHSVHLSSSIMRTKQANEQTSSNAPTMKPYPSSATLFNEQSTIAATVQTVKGNQQDTARSTDHSSETIITTTDSEFVTTQGNRIETATSVTQEKDDNDTTTMFDQSDASSISTTLMSSTSALTHDDMTSISTEPLLTPLVNRYFHRPSSTAINADTTKRISKIKYRKKVPVSDDDEDIIDELLFS